MAAGRGLPLRFMRVELSTELIVRESAAAPEDAGNDAAGGPAPPVIAIRAKITARYVTFRPWPPPRMGCYLLSAPDSLPIWPWPPCRSLVR